MTRYLLSTVLMCCAALTAPFGTQATGDTVTAEIAALSDLPVSNAAAIAAADALELGGGYKWAGSGVPREITHDGVRILAKSETGTYCSGVTFTVVVTAATELGLLDDKPAGDVKQFQRDWYGTHKDAAETQCVYALEQLGIGQAIDHDDALPGDFVQFWRTKSGHSVVFLGWVCDEDGHNIGIEYWSSQKSTDGIGVNTEYFAGVEGHEGSVDPDRLYIGRLNDPTTP